MYFLEILPFSKFPKLQNLVYLFYKKFSNSIFFFKKSEIMPYFNVCVCLENVLQDIAIGERVLVMWRKHLDGVPNVLIDNTNILSEGVGNATLRLRRRFMRTGYMCHEMCQSLQQTNH